MATSGDESARSGKLPSWQIVPWAACMLAWGLCLSAHAQYGGGSGTSDDPYRICTAEQMHALSTEPNDWDKHFRLDADIDLSIYRDASLHRIGFNYLSQEPSGWLPPFSGVFDGNGHTIANFTCVIDVRALLPTSMFYGDEHIGLFGYVRGPQAAIRNLTLIDPNIAVAPTCSERVAMVGALVGRLAEGAVENCTVQGGSISADRMVGGLVGFNDGWISHCDTDCLIELPEARPLSPVDPMYNFVDVPGHAFGGLAGQNSGEMSDCHSAATVSGREYVGGLVGDNSGLDPGTGIITDCFATGAVLGDETVGGLVGSNIGTIRHCHAAGPVTGNETVGGLAGSNHAVFEPALIESCQATGPVQGNHYTGGLAGGNHETIRNCCATGPVTGIDLTGGLTGFNSGSLEGCCATGTVTGTGQSTGGLSGTNGETISCCYAQGDVSGGDNAGGLIGFNFGTLYHCYACGSVIGRMAVGGLVGTGTGTATSSFWDVDRSGCRSSASDIGKSTTEMVFARTYTEAGWDFTGETANGTDDLWTMCCGRSAYPQLAWQNVTTGDFVTPEGIDGRDLLFLAQRWLTSTSLPCYGADLTFDGDVDFRDFALLGRCWRNSALETCDGQP